MLGNPLQPDTTLGPMASPRFAALVREHTAEAVAAGARACIDTTAFADNGLGGYLKHLVPGGVPWFLLPIMVPIEILGVTDPSGSEFEQQITGVTSDEATNGPGIPHDPDAQIVGDERVFGGCCFLKWISCERFN